MLVLPREWDRASGLRELTVFVWQYWKLNCMSITTPHPTAKAKEVLWHQVTSLAWSWPFQQSK